MGLFDAISAGLQTMAGVGKARREEEDLQSQKEYRRRDTELKGEQIKSTERQTQATLDLRRELLAKTQTFEREESLRKEQLEKDLLDFRKRAELELAREQMASAESMAEMNRELQLKIAMIQDSTARMGLNVKVREISQNLTLAKLNIIMEAYSLAQKYTKGFEGMMTGVTASMGEGSMGRRMAETEVNMMMNFLEMVDPTGQLGIKGAAENLSKSIVDQAYPSPSPSPGQPPTQAPSLPGEPTSSLPSIPTRRSSLAPSINPTDRTAPVIGQTLDPEDEWAIQSAASAIKNSPNPMQAMNEALTALDMPEYATPGLRKRMDPMSQRQYRESLKSRLRSLGQDFQIME